MEDFDLADMETVASNGLDSLFAREAHLTSPHKYPKSRVKVASIQQLQGFTRLSSETLVHKSEKDLWSLQRDKNGDFYMSRLFDDNGEPLKG